MRINPHLITLDDEALELDPIGPGRSSGPMRFRDGEASMAARAPQAAARGRRATRCVRRAELHGEWISPRMLHASSNLNRGA